MVQQESYEASPSMAWPPLAETTTTVCKRDGRAWPLYAFTAHTRIRYPESPKVANGS